MVEPEGPQMTAHYSAYELYVGLARLHALTRMHTPTRPGTRTYARARTHKNMQYFFLFHGNNDSRTRLSVLLHYIACLV